VWYHCVLLLQAIAEDPPPIAFTLIAFMALRPTRMDVLIPGHQVILYFSATTYTPLSSIYNFSPYGSSKSIIDASRRESPATLTDKYAALHQWCVGNIELDSKKEAKKNHMYLPIEIS